MSDTSLEDPNPVVTEEHELERALGPFNLIMIGIGSIIGAGIFVYHRPGGGGLCGPGRTAVLRRRGIGLRLRRTVLRRVRLDDPRLGQRLYLCLRHDGPLHGLSSSELEHWCWNISSPRRPSQSADQSGYFTELMQILHIPFPAALTNAPLCVVGDPPPCPTIVDSGTGLMGFIHQFGFTGAIMNLPEAGALLILALTAILVVGVRESANTNAIMVGIKLVVVLLVIAFGVSYIDWTNFTPFIPANTGKFGHFGLSGIMMGSAIIFFAYIGFDSVSVAAQETRNPQRDLPIGILASLFICTVLYILISVVLLGIAPYSAMTNVPNPVSFAVGKIATLHWLVPIIDIGASVGLASTIFVGLYGQSRIFDSMARDGFLPRMFAAVHPRFHTPHRGTIITGIFAAALAAFFPINFLALLVSIGTLLAFVVVCAGIMILRVQAPNAKRPFRTPYVWVVAPLGIFFCGAMMASLPIDTWWRLVLWTAAGLIIYFVYGIRHASPSKWKVAKNS